MPTRTGNFAIGFRRVGGEWAKNLKTLAHWAKDNGFDAIDLGRPAPEDVGALKSAGLCLGTVDLWGKLTSHDAGERKAAVLGAVDYVKECVALGATIFFTVVGGDPGRKRSENYAVAVQSYGAVAQAALECGAHIAVEGWPGGGNLPNLCCNPETCRAFIRDTNPRSVGLNYDPSHLIRMGIDHVRFLKEFAPHVLHVHGKDTEIIPEAVYEYGLHQSAVFAKGHGFGEHVWRYTIPGHGQARWTEILRILQAAGFRGIISVELEDESFNGSDEGEKAGLLHSLAFLRGA
jgi:sugar phosphate isomerase/epimerase